LRGKNSPPYKYKGPRPIEGDITIESIKFIFYRIYLFFLVPLLFQPLLCCSSFISAMSEDVLAGLPSLGQPCVRRPDGILPGRHSLVSRWIFPATPVLPVTRTGLTVLQGSPLRACWPRKGANKLAIPLGMKSSSSHMASCEDLPSCANHVLLT
jgi:hypothetical protein